MPFNVNSLKLLIKGELWFGKPINLNDPFEGEIKITEIIPKPTEEVLRILLKRIAPQDATNSNERLVMSESHPEFLQLYSNFLSGLIREEYGLCSFTKGYESIPLWSYYADSHKGFCLIFDRAKLEAGLKANYSIEVVEADYHQEMPKLQMKCDSDGYPRLSGSEVLKFKSKEFNKENEVRFIYHFKTYFPEDRSLKFDLSSIEGIIFGKNMAIDDERTIIHILQSKESFKNISVYKAERGGKNGRIRKKRIHPQRGDYYYQLYKDFGATQPIHFSGLARE